MNQIRNFSKNFFSLVLARFDIRAFILLTVACVIALSEVSLRRNPKKVVFDESEFYTLPQGNIAIDADDIPIFDDLRDIESSDISKSSSSALSSPQINEGKLTLKKGERLGSCLRRLGVSPSTTSFIIKEIMRLAAAEDLNNTKTFYYHKTDNQFDKGILYLGINEEIHIVKINTLFKITKVTKTVEKKTICTEGRFQNNLYKDAIRLGVPKRAVKQMIQLLGQEVNFQTDIQPNAPFEIMYEQYTDNQKNQQSDLTYASIVVQGEPIRIFRYKTKDGDQFFSERGASLRKGLLKNPVQGARISSPYGHRYHPISHHRKFHCGVDFAAPVGTPIVAAGDGVITFLGYKGGYGNCIIIRHNEYSTLYGHLCKFGKNQQGKLRQGIRVKQGEKIGFVGSTGHSTGPHLHFEVHHYGRPINPAKIKRFSNIQLCGKELQEFKAFVRAIDSRFNRARPSAVKFAQAASHRIQG